MSYTPTTWRNNQSPAINADNLNHIEQGISNAHSDIAVNTQNIESLTTQAQNNANNIASEISARQSADSVLGARIDNIISPTGTAPNPDEIVDARVGADGVTYTNLGTAIRTQVTDLKSDNSKLTEFFDTTNGNTSVIALSTTVTDYYVARDIPLTVKRGDLVRLDYSVNEINKQLVIRLRLDDTATDDLVNINPTTETTGTALIKATSDANNVRVYTGSPVRFVITKSRDEQYFKWDLSGGRAGWIAHGTGVFNWSAATTTWTFKRGRISKLKAFLGSDITSIDGIAFFSGDEISADTYMQSSVAWQSNKLNGAWYDVTVPSGCNTIAVTSRNESASFTPQILFLTDEVISVADSKFLSTSDITDVNNRIRSKNTQPLKIGWNYIYHFGMNGVAYRDAPVVVPSQSIFDVHNAVNLGYKCIEVNVHKTSDGKYVVTHGQDGALGHDFNNLDGTDAYGVVISNTTFADLRNNYLYRSSNPAYRVPITSLEEFLSEAKSCNINVMMQYVDATSMEIARGIMGDNMLFAYNAPRSAFDGLILEYLGYTSKTDIVNRANAVGAPYVYSMSNPTNFTDVELTDICKTLHDMGCFVASAYVGINTMQRLFGLGFDFFAIESDVQPDAIIKGKQLIFNENGTVSWTDAVLT